MPSIVAVPYPTRGQVLLEINFADVPGATNVCVEAVTGLGTAAETRRSLHPYISYNTDGCLALSCGQAVMWDTETSCDVPTVWCATAVSAAGTTITTATSPLLFDVYGRVVAAGWGTSTGGAAWTVVAGTAADFTVNGARGSMSHTVVNAIHRAIINGPLANIEASIWAVPGVVATGAPIEANLLVRRDETGNTDYRATLQFGLAGAVTLILTKTVAGVTTTLGSVAVGTYTATSIWVVKIQTWGQQQKTRAWDSTTPEPTVWAIETTDTSITAAGAVGARSVLTVGNTNVLPVVVQFDNLLVTDVCAVPAAVSACTESFTLPCDTCFRLSDPVRPCNDVKVCECADVITCGATGGVFFAGMTADAYSSNSGSFVPTNAKNPIPISRTRRGPSGEIDVVATSFAARDQLLNLFAPGSVLLWRGPANYGTGDRYLDFGDIASSPQLADLTSQPRLISLPNQQVGAPVGPTQGVCGARVKDLCDVYLTWDAMVAAGLTWADLLRGGASATPSGLATWDSINAQNASWNVLLANEPIWSDVLDGD